MIWGIFYFNGIFYKLIKRLLSKSLSSYVASNDPKIKIQLFGPGLCSLWASAVEFRQDFPLVDGTGNSYWISYWIKINLNSSPQKW